MIFSKAELYLTTRLEKETISMTFFLWQNIEIIVEFSHRSTTGKKKWCPMDAWNVGNQVTVWQFVRPSTPYT